jgi:NitT/TauT family transport system permease protein
MKYIKNFFNIIIFLLIWQIFIFIFKIPNYLFPSPFEVFNSLISNFKTIISNGSITLMESFLGFLLANSISIILALFISFKKQHESSIMSMAVTLKTIPIIAITPLLVLWFGSGFYSKIITAALVCFFPSLVNTLRGVKSIDRNLIELFNIYSASNYQKIKHLIIPSISPYLFSAFKISSSLAIIGALVGEFITANKGIGFLIISNYYSLNIAAVFANLIVISAMGIGFYNLINFFEKKIIKWNTIENN